jgi:histidyl-tRNA synthetase
MSGQPDKVVEMVTAIDKLDKIGQSKVEDEMRAKGITDEAIASIAPLFRLSGTWPEQKEMLERWLGSQPVAQEGLKNLSFIFDAGRTA